MKKQIVHIFDLDRTVIDSDHRTPYFPDGDLDLAKYRELQTHENIMQDTLLPLANTMKILINRGDIVAVVTARRMTKSDYVMLRKHGLRVPLICSRDKVHKVEHISGCASSHMNSSDSEYKRIWFKALKQRFNPAQYDFVMYDDHAGVLKVALEEGFSALDAIQLNKMLDNCYELGFTDGFAEGETLVESHLAEFIE